MLVVLFRHGDGVLARETAGAEIVRVIDRGEQALVAQVGEAVRADELADIFNAVVRRDQFVGRRKIDSEITRVPRRRTRNPHVDLAGPGIPDHVDDPF